MSLFTLAWYWAGSVAAALMYEWARLARQAPGPS
jgi:hypothetical protein